MEPLILELPKSLTRRITKKVFLKIKIYQTLKINGKKKKVDGKLIIYIRNYNI
jgi:hypothetical protein